MSTQPQYDPEKANAWTRDLPAKPPIKERPSFIDEANNPYAMSLAIRVLNALRGMPLLNYSRHPGKIHGEFARIV